MAAPTIAYGSVPPPPGGLERSPFPGAEIEIVNDPRSVNEWGADRNHYLLRVAIDEHTYGALWTPAVPQLDSGITVVNKLGLGESLKRDGLGDHFHIDLARERPNTDILTLETPGVGNVGDHVGLRRLPGHTTERLAAWDFKLLKLMEQRRKVLLGTSAGTATTAHVAKLNLERDEPLDIAGVVLYDNAVERPKHAIKNIALLAPLLVTDTGLEWLLKSSMPDRKRIAGTIGHSGIPVQGLPAMIRQGLALFPGVAKQHTKQMIDNYHTAVITGTSDSLGELTAWRELRLEQLKRALAGNVHTLSTITGEIRGSLAIYPVEGRGHAIVFNTAKRARKIASVIGDIVLDDMAQPETAIASS